MLDGVVMFVINVVLSIALVSDLVFPKAPLLLLLSRLLILLWLRTRWRADALKNLL